MVDEVTYQSGYWFVLASMLCIRVEGTVLNTYSATPVPGISGANP
jgi:hypothetical protein